MPEHGVVTGLPPLASEDFVCAACGFAFPDCDAADSARRLPRIAADIRSFVAPIERSRLTAKRTAETWSGIEYLCHVRDVYQASTIRLYRVRTEDAPQIEPLYNDVRATRFRYAERDAAAVLDEIDAAIAGCCAEIGLVTDWNRTMTRLPGEQRTARWLARAAVHEGVHHLLDLRTVCDPGLAT
jgi:hypothetical protein